MKTIFAIATGILALVNAALAVSNTTDNGLTSNKKPTKEYIITFMRNETIPKQLDDYLDEMALNKEDSLIYVSTNDHVRVYVLNMCDDHAEKFQNLVEVSTVEEKAMIQSFAITKSGAPWGLQRISDDNGASGSPQGQDFTYSFDDSKLGAGVDIYIIDTGVRTSHAVFAGRATQGFTANGSFFDGDGHGTHVAGTAGGNKFGVAQGANIIEVKVLGDNGGGFSSDTIAGMDWVISNHDKRKNQPGFVGSIMSMSWGLKGIAKAVDEVIAAASDAGIHVSVAAGNNGADACNSTPAHLGGTGSSVVTVGSVDIHNRVSYFSNIGKCVDVYAPGEQILSAWNTGNTVINFLSGTSMACPHATGVMAYLMAEDVAGLGQNPAALKAKLLATARQGKIAGNTGGSANLLLSNGANGDVAKRLVKNYLVPDHSGSPAARAIAAVNRDFAMDKRFQLHSRDAQLRF